MTVKHSGHRQPIVHGDFKASDVLVEARTLTPKIANFGLWDFKNFFIRNTLPEGDFLNPCQAPEVMIGGERPTLFSDAWSLGAVILQWMTRLPPWDMQVWAGRSQEAKNLTKLKTGRVAHLLQCHILYF